MIPLDFKLVNECWCKHTKNDKSGSAYKAEKEPMTALPSRCMFAIGHFVLRNLLLPLLLRQTRRVTVANSGLLQDLRQVQR